MYIYSIYIYYVHYFFGHIIASLLPHIPTILITNQVLNPLAVTFPELRILQILPLRTLHRSGEAIIRAQCHVGDLDQGRTLTTVHGKRNGNARGKAMGKSSTPILVAHFMGDR